MHGKAGNSQQYDAQRHGGAAYFLAGEIPLARLPAGHLQPVAQGPEQPRPFHVQHQQNGQQCHRGKKTHIAPRLPPPTDGDIIKPLAAGLQILLRIFSVDYTADIVRKAATVLPKQSVPRFALGAA